MLNSRYANAVSRPIPGIEKPVEHVKSGRLHLLTYNVAGLPDIVSSADESRTVSMQQIGRLMGRYDIVNLQEDFNFHEEVCKFNTLRHKTTTKGAALFGDGLNSFSKYPMHSLSRIAWRACAGMDCLTPKGFSKIRVQIAQSVFVDVYNVHMTSGVTPQAIRARRDNFEQLTAYIATKSIGLPLIVMGDFNAFHAYTDDVVSAFMEENRMDDTWVLSQNAGTTPVASSHFLIPDKLHIDDAVESLDKVMYRGTDKVQFHPVRYHVEKELFQSERNRPLSDHLAVSAELFWCCNDED